MIVTNTWSLFLLAAAGSFVVGVSAEEQCLNSPNRKVYYRPTVPPTKAPTKAPAPQPTTSRPSRAPVNLVTTATTAAQTTSEEIVTVPPAPTNEPYCACADKSRFIENTGKVTGGGWIYLTPKTYFSCAKAGGIASECGIYNNIDATSSLNGTKANYGFNAMYRQGVPHGSTNFDLDGKNFHFHSEMQNTPHKFLEVLEDGVRARWMGLGAISTKHNTQGKSGWKYGYCFMVAVEDNGEPGYQDEWRLRVWDCTGVTGNSNCNLATSPSMKVDLLATSTTLEMFTSLGNKEECLVFDTNYIPTGKTSPDGTTAAAYVTQFPLPSDMSTLHRFNGTEVGELGSQHGGGNIQIHLKNKQSKFADWMQAANIPCTACPPNKTALDESDGGFVTGGGWIILSETSYLKPSSCNTEALGCPAVPTSAPTPAPVAATTATVSTTTATKPRGKNRQLQGGPRNRVRGAVFDDQDALLAPGLACHSVDIDGLKANYGFNAKHINGIPQGSFNFDVDGAGFHFHTDAWDTANSEFDCLEVVCNEKYGKSMQEGAARFTGYGRISRTMGSPPPTNGPGWVEGYRFWIAVQDKGEPGYLDEIRVRIEDTVSCPGQILFDTNLNVGPVITNFDLSTWACPTWDPLDVDILDPKCDSAPCLALPDFGGDSLVGFFNGTQAGLDDMISKGGGNIQLHCKGGPTR